MALDKKKLALCIIGCIAAVGVTAYLGSAFTDAQGAWYKSLAKPAFTPPPEAFPIAWGIIYVCLAVSAVLVCNMSYRIRELTLYVYGTSCALNVLWTYVFFQNRDPTAALVVLILLLGSVAAMMILSAKINKAAAYLLLPYLLWGTFALVLNYSIIMMN
jgi:translocator protein